MSDSIGRSEPALREAAIRDHLANERTLLAWQRTALTIVGIGFVVDRLSLDASRGLGPILGLGLVLFGGIAAALGVWRFVSTERAIDTVSYRPVIGVHLLFAGLIVAMAGLLAAYLLLAK